MTCLPIAYFVSPFMDVITLHNTIVAFPSKKVRVEKYGNQMTHEVCGLVSVNVEKFNDISELTIKLLFRKLS